MKRPLTHPKVGASWEGFIIEQILQSEPHDEAFFRATHQGAEIDLMLRRGGGLYGIECKRTDTPRLTPSIRNAIADLGWKHILILYPGTQRFPLSDQVEAVPVRSLAKGESLFV